MKCSITESMNVLQNFIVFEGLDGAGTTTQAKLLTEYLRKQGKTTYLTCEPTDAPIGKLIRDILSGKKKVTSRALAMLYAADRDDHLYGSNGIIDSLHTHSFVISDRYFYSSVAYQSIHTPIEEVLSFNAAYPDPMIIFYIDTPVQECLKRIEENRSTKDIFEYEQFQQAVYANYESSLSQVPDGVNLYRVDGMLSITEIRKKINAYINQVINIASP